MAKNIVQFAFPTTICFGPGSVKRLPASLRELGIKKPLLVTDEGLTKTEIVDTVTRILDKKSVTYTLFTGVHPNPLVQDIENAAEIYNSNACDGVIALGGGSPLDAGKVIAVLAFNEGPLTQYDIMTGGNVNIKGPLPPVIAIPTTAGTGSEVGRCSVITDPAKEQKFLICHPEMMPKRAILDPELTISLPPSLTAGTGMDALTHNIEALLVDMFHPMCDGIALKAIQMIAENIETAVKKPDNIEARGNMLAAASMGAVAFQKDLGAAHSMAHPLSTLCNVPHGLANAICLPHVMQYNKDVCTKKLTWIAQAFGINTQGLSDSDSADKAIEAVVDLNKRIGIPATLADAGVDEGQLEKLADKAFTDCCHLSNPRKCTRDDLMELYKEAFGK